MIIEIDGIKINYIVEGTGKPVVLLHGWGCSTKTFEPVQKHMMRHFKVYNVDLPGFGESGMLDRPWNVSDYAGCVKKLLEALKIENPVLIGHSNGGRIIIYLLGALGIKASKVILTGAAGIKPKRKPMYYIKVWSFKTIKKTLMLPVVRNFSQDLLEGAKNYFGSSDYKNAPEVMRKTLVQLLNEDLTYLLPNIKASTLLIWGENDTATPVADGKLMEKMIPDSGLVILKNATHFAYLEKLSEFLIIIDNFLAKDMEV